MPKHTVTLTAKQIVEIGLADTSELADHVIEYAPDFAFPDNADVGTIELHDTGFNMRDDLVLEFTFDEAADEDESDEESESEEG